MQTRARVRRVAPAEHAAGRVPKRVPQSLPEPALRQLDLDVDRCGGRPHAPRFAKRLRERERVPVVGEDRRREDAHVLLAGTVREPREELGRDPAPVPLVDDHDGHLRLVRIGAPHESCDAHRVTRLAVRDQRLVVVMVDLCEIREVACAEPVERRKETPVSRLGAELLEAAYDRRLVVRTDRPDRDRRAVAELDEVVFQDGQDARGGIRTHTPRGQRGLSPPCLANSSTRAG